MTEPDWRIIELENRGLSVQSAHFLGEGWNSRAYLVNNELVYRFPKRPGHWEELEREVKCLAFAADFLPLAVPRYAHVAPDSPAAAYGYAVYRYLQGHAMNVNALSLEKRAAAAEVIGVLAETEREKGKKALLALASERRVAMRQKFVLISGVTFSRERECSK